MGLVLDPQLIRDLTVLITSSTAGGMILEALKQPVINGFFLAGSVVGPGGFKLIKVALEWCMTKHSDFGSLMRCGFACILALF